MRRERLLDKIVSAAGDRMLVSLGADVSMDRHGEWANPGLRQVKLLSDEELAEVIGREPQSKLGRLAESVLKSRESWRTPAKWALVVSLLSLCVAVWAILRTL